MKQSCLLPATGFEIDLSHRKGLRLDNPVVLRRYFAEGQQVVNALELSRFHGHHGHRTGWTMLDSQSLKDTRVTDERTKSFRSLQCENTGGWAVYFLVFSFIRLPHFTHQD